MNLVNIIVVTSIGTAMAISSFAQTPPVTPAPGAPTQMGTTNDPHAQNPSGGAIINNSASLDQTAKRRMLKRGTSTTQPQGRTGVGTTSPTTDTGMSATPGPNPPGPNPGGYR